MLRYMRMITLLAIWGTGMAAIGAGLEIGDPAPGWHDLPGVDGRRHSLDELKEHKAVLVVFFANSCPDCELYRERINAIDRDYAKRGVALVLMSVSLADEDNLEAMTRHAREKKLPGDYLFDKSQQIGKRFGARITPEAFLLDNERRLVYRGAIDDHWKTSKVKRQHLRLALEQLLTRKMIDVPSTEAEGCHIEYEAP